MNEVETLLRRHWECPVWRLSHPDGSPYLDRYVLAGDDCLENHTGAPLHMFLHRIYTADADRHCHNHPWSFSEAYVLQGGYTEHREGLSYLIEKKHHYYSAGDRNQFYPWEYHSIVSVEPDTWTLFIGQKETDDWGFNVDGKHVPHAKYFKRKDVQKMKTERIR